MNMVLSAQASRWLRFVCLILLACVATGCENRRVILTDLSQREANEIEPFLVRRGIDARKVRLESKDLLIFSIDVPSGDATVALEILNQHGLPRPKPKSLLDTVGSGGLVPSEQQERIKFQAGLAEEIASSIRSFDGVLEARVILSFPEENPLAPESERPQRRASVFLKHNGVLDDPNSQLRSKIKLHVAGSIDGLTLENVTVVGTRARFVGDPETGSVEGADAEEMSWVRVWSVVISRDSLTRFRLIFFSLVTFTLLFLFAALWMAWKLLPVLRSAGGLGALLSLAPIDLSKAETKESKEKQEEDKPKADQEANPEDQESLDEETQE